MTEIARMRARIAKKFDDEVDVYDVSRARDKIRAIKGGVRKTPTVIVHGKKYEGLEKFNRKFCNTKVDLETSSSVIFK